MSLFKSDENNTGAHLMPNTQGTTLMGDVAERNDIVLIEKGMADESGVTSLKERFIRDGLSQPIS
ncbi:MAG: hypothetical protein Q4B54_03915, partial [Coriobacteriales bacterium]|nr:hypothetical protein [Coriobacteriales bacterium]